MRDQRGFTLFEMLVVMGIIALMFALVLPSISSYFQISINSATRDLGSAVKEAYNSTVLTGRVYRMAYDLKNNQYWVESGPANVLLDTDASRENEKRRGMHNSGIKEDNPFTIDKTITRGKITLPRGVVFVDVVTQQSKDPVKTGTAYTHFFPQGLTEQTIIHLSDGGTHKTSLVISPLVGTSDVYDRYITSEQAFGKR